MTTSEHADEWPAGRLAEGARGSSGPYPPLTNRNEVAAALASTPSPAQPTEASDLKSLWDVIDNWLTEMNIEDLNPPSLVESLTDAILAAGFRLAPSPVQGADDRLAQAEAVIAEVLAGPPASVRNLDQQVGWILNRLANYQHSPQAALNEVQAEALEEAARDLRMPEKGRTMTGDIQDWLRARAAELRGGVQAGDDQ